jgi:hypothetical protein
MVADLRSGTLHHANKPLTRPQPRLDPQLSPGLVMAGYQVSHPGKPRLDCSPKSAPPASQDRTANPTNPACTSFREG